MPNAHDEDMYEITGEEMPPEGVAVPEISQAPEEAGPADAVVEAELVDGGDTDAGPGSVAEEVDAELVDGDADEGGEASGEDARPSVHGRLAKPHTGKDSAEKTARAKRFRPGFARRVVFTAILVVLAALLVGTGLFCWQKWMRFDDAADIQGVWKVQSTGDTIVFDGRALKLTKGISYEYQLDTNDKSMTYTFGEYAGGGHYYFSGDRQMLIIVDGDERLGALAEVGFLPDELVQHDDANDNMTVLAKVSDDTSAEPSGTATGVATGKSSGEREYVVKPEPSTSSSSEKKKSSSSKKDEEEEDAENEHRGFVDEDGDGFDDETDLEYEDFLEYQASLDDENAEDEEAEDGEGDESDLYAAGEDETDTGEDEEY